MVVGVSADSCRIRGMWFVWADFGGECTPPADVVKGWGLGVECRGGVYSIVGCLSGPGRCYKHVQAHPLHTAEHTEWKWTSMYLNWLCNEFVIDNKSITNTYEKNLQISQLFWLEKCEYLSNGRLYHYCDTRSSLRYCDNNESAIYREALCVSVYVFKSCVSLAITHSEAVEDEWMWHWSKYCICI